MPGYDNGRPGAHSQSGVLRIQQLADFEEFRYIFGQWGGRFQQTSRGAFLGEARLYAGKSLRAFHADTNQAIFTRGLDASDFTTVIPINAGNAATHWRGRKLAIGQLLIKGPDVEYYNQTMRNTVIRGLLVPVRTIEQIAGEAAEVLIGKRSFSAIALRPEKTAMRRFEFYLGALLDPEQSKQGNDRSRLEQSCLSGLAECLVDPKASDGVDILHSTKLELLNGALEVMHQRLADTLNSKLLCDELQVNARWLRRVFKEAFGAGPVAFYRLMRLNKARRNLKSARGSEETVAEIARRYGFNRLGTFADEYRRQFGELPSETLGVRGYPGVKSESQRRSDVLRGA